MNDKFKKLKLSTVEINDDGISEYDKNLRAVHIPNDKIIKVVLDFGSAVEYPFRTIAISVFFIMVGITFGNFIIDLIANGDFPSNGGYKSIGLLGSGVILLFLGLWFLIGLFKKRYYLIVSTDKGNRKVIFQGNNSIEEIKDFIKEANTKFEYAIDYNLSLKRDREKRRHF